TSHLHGRALRPAGKAGGKKTTATRVVNRATEDRQGRSAVVHNVFNARGPGGPERSELLSDRRSRGWRTPKREVRAAQPSASSPRRRPVSAGWRWYRRWSSAWSNAACG